MAHRGCALPKAVVRRLLQPAFALEQPVRQRADLTAAVLRSWSGQDAEAARGAKDVIKFEFHAGFYFILRSINQQTGQSQEIINSPVISTL